MAQIVLMNDAVVEAFRYPDCGSFETVEEFQCGDIYSVGDVCKGHQVGKRMLVRT
jgi:hypothetical protein